MKEILVATKNAGKISEYNELFKNLPYKLLTLTDLGIKDGLKEDGKTFTENAVKKAEFYSQLSNLPILAEDSGLEIDYLDGEPGVLSRRWLGRECSDKEFKETNSKDSGIDLIKKRPVLKGLFLVL